MEMLSPDVGKFFDAVADGIDCDRAEVLLLRSKQITRNNERIAVTYLQFRTNPGFDAILKNAGETRFDSAWQARNLVVTETAIATLAQPVADHFQVIVDLDTQEILKNRSPSKRAALSRIAFNAIPFHLSIEIASVIEQIAAYRPHDAVKKLYIHNGTTFISVADLVQVWSRLPFLLFRYCDLSSKPSYVSFSTIANSVEEIALETQPKRIKRMIARYLDACRLLDTQAFETDVTSTIAEHTRDREWLQGDFGRFAESLALFKLTFTNLPVIPLVSDYITLAHDRYGADSAAAGIIAYVDTAPSKRSYFDRIAQFFNHKPGAYPIVFSRTILERWDDLEDDEFLATLAHEIGHWLMLEDPNTDQDEDLHGVRWAIYTDLIEGLLTEGSVRTRHRSYHPDSSVANLAIEHTVKHGILALKAMMSDQGITKTMLSAIAQMTYSCVEEIANETVLRLTGSDLSQRQAPPKLRDFYTNLL